MRAKKAPSESVVDKNYFHLLWSGVAASVSGSLVSPSLVLPFLYLALGAPQFVAGLLLPCVKAARLVSEIFGAPFLKRSDRAIPAVIIPNLASAVALSAIAIFAATLSEWLIAALFVLIAFVLGMCNGIANIGLSQVYGSAIDEARRNRIFFSEVAISGILVIAVVWLSRDLLAGEDPYHRHIIVLWIGIAAIVIAAITMVGTQILREYADSDRPDDPPPAKTSPLRELATGFETGIKYPWYRQFLLARLFFLSVELAMPFYTIHAATIHLSTKHSLSIFVIAASAGGSFGALIWKRLIAKSVKLTMVVGACVAAVSAALALLLETMGYAQNVWVYASVIFLLAFGSGGVVNGRYIYLISMTEKTERPYLVALGDVVAGLVGVALAAALGFLAHLQDERAPLAILVALNICAAYMAIRLTAPDAPADPEHMKDVPQN
ncbi:MAG: MFS transporter [Pseudomonadota bacterium]